MFRVGEIVVVTGPPAGLGGDEGRFNLVGKIGKVCDLSPTTISVDIPGQRFNWWFYPSDLRYPVTEVFKAIKQYEKTHAPQIHRDSGKDVD